jgi:alanyl-tRNA synthetase
MQSSEIRQKFLSYFERQKHTIRPSSSLVPADDPTLLFTNAGMVQFKKIFLGQEPSPWGPRATTSQKCVRAGGKHNDLEQVGHTARHHTFFEMLGNFSFGDYFKRDAIKFAWEFVTKEIGIKPELLYVTVFHEDEEARALWKEVAKLPDARIYGLGERDNFWQMADTGPCGPCSEIYVDLAHVAKDWRFPEGATGEWTDLKRKEFSKDAFVEGAEAGRFLEIWNLVFMQFDRQPDGTMKPLPKPSVDTGAGLERIAAVMQGVTNNYHTDLFAPLIQAVSDAVGTEYWGRESDKLRVVAKSAQRGGVVAVSGTNSLDPASYRVIADHARAVAFLIADGVFPANDGRGYVLRRILRRAVRHAWLLGRAEPTLVGVVAKVIETMSGVFPELQQRSKLILETTRAEEERFLATIEGGMLKFDQLAPERSTQGSTGLKGTISGEDAFRLYDTFGFPIDLTELMARERGYTVDIAGFERALGAQREMSREERKTREIKVSADKLTEGGMEGWERPAGAKSNVETRFVGYDRTEADTTVESVRRLDGGRIAAVLHDTPFYAESGGQISDKGEIVGQGWRVDVDEVRKIEGRTAAVGKLGGTFAFGKVTARVPADVRRDTERNHTATHLLHAALRKILGEHVHQAGSLVAPDRLRFDFTHHGPVTKEQLAELELFVNRAIWADTDVTTVEKPYKEAVAGGAMALFGEKYGDVVRVVSVPGVSQELCGGTHARNTGQIALFKIVSESGVAAGVRRIEAVTGPNAYEMVRAEEQRIARLSELLKAPADALEKRVAAMRDDLRALQKQLDESRKGGGDEVGKLISSAATVNGARLICGMAGAGGLKELQSLGDALREQMGSGVAVVGSALGDGKHMVLTVVTDDLRERGVHADALVKQIAAAVGGRGGGKAHMAQAGVPDAGALAAALGAAQLIVRTALGNLNGGAAA